MSWERVDDYDPNRETIEDFREVECEDCGRPATPYDDWYQDGVCPECRKDRFAAQVAEDRYMDQVRGD